MKNKPSLFIEILWICIGLVSLVMAVKEFINADKRQAGMFVLMAVISFLMAWFRDSQRKKS